MFRTLLGTGFILLAIAPPGASAEHSPLLPRPREIRYGVGALALRGLEIYLSADASPEDRFTANELSSSLSGILGSLIPVSDSSPAGPAITLERTGAVDALPTPGEKAGPDTIIL